MEKYIVHIKQIEWLDKENLEANVLFELNGRRLWAFCQPCHFMEDEIASVYFHFIEEDIAEEMFWQENKANIIELRPSGDDGRKYHCSGRIQSIHPVIVDCKDISFSLGDWLEDESVVGSYVYFRISLLSIDKIYVA